MRDLTKISIIKTQINADLTFKLKNDNRSTTGNNSIPSVVVRKNVTFVHCNDYFSPKNVQLTVMYIIALAMK